MLQAELKVTSGKQAGNVIPLTSGKFLVGREEDCHLRPNSDLISRHHCVFTLDEYALRIRDLGSTNGTLVNGEKIRGGVVLKPGDIVSIGKLEFEVSLRDPSGDDTKTQLRIDSETQVNLPEGDGQPATAPAPSGQVIAAEEGAVEEPSSADTLAEMPVMQPPPPPQGDTAFMGTPGMPMQPPLGYPMYPQQMMPYGYPGYPGMFPQQMGYPGMPGMYPQQPMLPQPEQGGSAAPPASPPVGEVGLRLPDPSETGAKAPAAPDPNATPEQKSAAAKSKEEAPGMAADIIQQYLKRRPGGGS